MALFWLAEFVGLEKIMDECFPKKTIKGIPRSRVLLLKIIHRADSPGSMSVFSDWVKGTSLSYHLGHDYQKLTAQDIWEAMDGIKEEAIQKAHDQLMGMLMKQFNIDLGQLHLDYTNYYTWISSRNLSYTICYRGHNKQKRDDLRQFNLAVITCPELQVPLAWDVYEGNTNDKTEFADFVVKVTSFITCHGLDPQKITVTFDGGNNSAESFSDLKFHIICAHSMTGMKELYDIELDKYADVELENGSTRKAYRIDNLEFSGITGTGILTFSQALLDGQKAQLDKDKEKCQAIFNEVLSRLNNPRSSLQVKLKKAYKEYLRTRKEIIEYNEEIREKAAEYAQLPRRKRKDD